MYLASAAGLAERALPFALTAWCLLGAPARGRPATPNALPAAPTAASAAPVASGATAPTDDLAAAPATAPKSETDAAEAIRPPSVDLDSIRLDGARATAPTKGGDRATLTLVPDLQRAANRLLRAARPDSGGVVAIDVRSGRVIVWTDYRRNGPGGELDHPRAPAASLFKIITTAALFEKTPVTPGTRVCWSGGEHGIARTHLDPPRGGERECGPFSDALGYSRNAVYAQLATRHLARDELVGVAERIGFNAPVPFDQTVPLGTLSVPVGDLEYARTAAGFRDSKLSVLGAAQLGYLVANGGWATQLHIVERAGDYRVPDRPARIERLLRRSTARRLARMMEVTVHSGTSLDAFTDGDGNDYLPGIRVAGKTGTLRASENAPLTSWFVGFAPSRQPRIVVAVLLQNGKVWRRKANEVARDLLRYHFARKGYSRVHEPF